jgi:ParB family transcriptional regulator, chromosome partitioning protein
MTTTGAAEKLAAKPAEKVEKRRALGRGLESLLPGPRVVAGTGARDAGSQNPPPSTSLRAGFSQEPREMGRAAAAPTLNPETIEIRAVVEEELDAAGAGSAGPPVGDAGTASETEVPHFVPDDKSVGSEVAPAPPVPSEGFTIPAMAAEPVRGTVVKQIPVGSIEENPYQTRSFFDKQTLAELADSIKVNGVLQPVVVRPAEKEGRYILVLGERRLQASKLAESETIPAIVRRVSEQQAAEMTLIENLQREDLNCMEQAEAFRVLSKEFSMTQEEIGKRVGMSRESVSNYMRLLRLPDKVMEYLLHDRLSFSEARELLGLHDEKNLQAAADVVVSKHMSLEEIEDLVAKYNGWPDFQDPVKKPGFGGGARWQDPNVRAAQTELERWLRVRVRIKDRKGKGKIVIEYATVDDYERVVGMLKGQK